MRQFDPVWLRLRGGRREPPSTLARFGLNHPAAKEGLDGWYGQGPGVEKPLATIALGLLQEQQLLRPLDALGEGLDGECLAELRERVNDRLALLAERQARDKRSVDLQSIDG